MLKPALTIIKDELFKYVQFHHEWDSEYSVKLANIAQLEFENLDKFNDSILISLIHTELEDSLRNSTFSKQSAINGQTIYQNPKVSINIYVLFCAKFDPYEDALEWLSQVFEFFQSKNVFTTQNTPAIEDYESLSNKQKMSLKLIVDQHSLSLEQLNQLWGTLGRNLMPHVLYKIRLVRIFSDQIQQTGSPITQLQTNEMFQ